MYTGLGGVAPPSSFVQGLIRALKGAARRRPRHALGPGGYRIRDAVPASGPLRRRARVYMQTALRNGTRPPALLRRAPARLALLAAGPSSPARNGAPPSPPAAGADADRDLPGARREQRGRAVDCVAVRSLLARDRPTCVSRCHLYYF